METAVDSVIDVNSAAVCIRDLQFSYSKSLILDGINLTVSRATIYGLLGSSGCGKTTLLRCALGRLKPKKGVIEIFGGKPGLSVCQIPGAGVGFMPQELGLYLDFTIAETLTYFGRIFAMNSVTINQEIDSLIKLLQLPRKTKLIGKLSGGQQRRVSLATALLHCPPLLILDEPTVGVDPLLRQTIWYHLRSLCKSGLTIILTTHYIDEARGADVIGFMRDGKLLAEDNPDVLLRRYQLPNLEKVFLKLCYIDFENKCDNNGQCLPNTNKIDSSHLTDGEAVANISRDRINICFRNKSSDCISEYENVDNRFDAEDDANSTTGTTNNDNEINVRKLSESLTQTEAQSDNKNSGAITDTTAALGNDISDQTKHDCLMNGLIKANYNHVYIKPFEDNCDTAVNGFKDCDQKLIPNKIHIKKSNTFRRLLALLHKNFLRLSRNWKQLIFYVILPAIQLALLLMSISDGPTDIRIAVYNEEDLFAKGILIMSDEGELTVNENAMFNEDNGKEDEHSSKDGIEANNWGQLFLNCLSNETFKLNYYDNYDTAFEAVVNGKAVVMIDINHMFTKSLRLKNAYIRIEQEIDENTLEESQISIHMDRSNQALGFQIERYFYEAMLSFAEILANRSGVNPNTLRLPLVFEQPIYGSEKESLRDFIRPGCYVLLAFFSTAAVTAHLIIEERRDGLTERSLVAGVTVFEFLASHAITQFCILCVQIVLMLLIPFVAFRMSFEGSSLTLIIALSLSQGLCGIMFGLMTSAMCTDIIYAAMFILVMFFVTIIVGGVFWPMENMPVSLRALSVFMPSSLPIQSMRCILFRQWTLTHFPVYIGFVATYAWLAVFTVTAFIFLRRTF